jgi:hypothetical protein
LQIEENQKKLQKFLIVVVFVEGQDDICENLVFAEFVLEKKLMPENCLELENQVGNNKLKVTSCKLQGSCYSGEDQNQ